MLPPNSYVITQLSCYLSRLPYMLIYTRGYKLTNQVEAFLLTTPPGFVPESPSITHQPSPPSAWPRYGTPGPALH